eukprot:TRINITY_DN1459_c0_g1_i3.p1 TRINITY_DN1459_c0_g1~~TRINITY_DN1459_c0_g1_i3.p1  ORF type:complete len:407 (-),score=115.97 TRINITY_DN1459_c0_g1_i3:137-1357(-)
MLLAKGLVRIIGKGHRFFASSKLPAGNLYTWGSSSGLGYIIPANVTKELDPKRIEQFSNNVVRVAMGANHSAVVTNDGALWTFGNGETGALGLGEKVKNSGTPQKVEFFEKHGLKVVDVACGEKHTVVLTDDGDVWTFGSGGRKSNMLFSIFFASCGALGHGNQETAWTPKPVEALRKFPPIKHVTSGQNFCLAQNIENDLFHWGRGEWGVFGDGKSKSCEAPHKNSYLEQLKKEGLTVLKLKSVSNYSVALMSDGLLYAWGSNDAGQLGIKSDIGIEIHETAIFPSPIINDDFAGKKVVDFEIGENIMAILLETGEVFWAGLKMAYKPELLPLPKDKKIKLIGASARSLAIVTDGNEIYMKNAFLKQTSEDLSTGILFTDNKAFDGGNIVAIGGGYRNRYAIVKN